MGHSRAVSEPPLPTPGRAGLPGLGHGVAAATAELLLAVFAFILGLGLLLALPGVQPGIFWLLDAVFGRPDLSAEKIRQAHAIVLTPLATLVAALLYGWLGRRVDRLPGPPAADPPPAIASLARPVGLARSAAEIAGHIVLAVVGSYLLALLLHLLGAPVAEQTLVLELTASGDPRRPELAILMFSALVLAPLGEELFFRRELFTRTSARGGPIAGYLVSALLFAAFHGNLQGFVVYTWLGLVFAHVFVRTGRIGAAVAVHLGNNAVTLALLLLAPPT
jgi:membrane protease YdiL (CAAX protease family)